MKEEEVDELIRELAQERHEAPAALKTRLTRDGELPTIERRLRSQKALDLIYQQAKINPKSETMQLVWQRAPKRALAWIGSDHSPTTPESEAPSVPGHGWLLGKAHPGAS